MTLTEHLEELRWCLLKSVLAIVIASSASYFFSEAIFSFIVAPLRQNLQPGQNLIGTSVTEAFFVEIKVALAAGVLFSCPVIFYEIWRFVAPGLSKGERKWVPVVVAGNIDAGKWTEFVVSCVLTAAAWVVADSYREASSPARTASARI